jgi:dTDP-4-amino-4,6-dideoxygalactose transaminase
MKELMIMYHPVKKEIRFLAKVKGEFLDIPYKMCPNLSQYAPENGAFGYIVDGQPAKASYYSANPSKKVNLSTYLTKGTHTLVITLILPEKAADAENFSYGWVDMGSSFLPSEVNAAFLWAQLESIDEIQEKRKLLWNRYKERLEPLASKGFFTLPNIPEYASLNAHMFYLVLPDLASRTALIATMKANGILAVFHYLSLHSSDYYQDKHDGRALVQCDRYADCLVRLPLYYDLTIEEVDMICDHINAYYK